MALKNDSHRSRWTFLTNHSHVLLCLHRDPEIRLRDVADQVGITERAVQAIVQELVQEEIIEVEKLGRRNAYRIHHEARLRHPLENHRRVGDLLRLLE
jgi:predicted transcriptional regulator